MEITRERDVRGAARNWLEAGRTSGHPSAASASWISAISQDWEEGDDDQLECATGVVHLCAVLQTSPQDVASVRWSQEVVLHVHRGTPMSVHRYAAKRDENEPDIIKALRANGCVVWQLSGKGIPDLLVLHKGKKWLADVKMPGKPTTKPQEDAWEEAATKARCSVFILRTPEDAVKMLNNALQPWEPANLSRAEATARRLRTLGMRAEVVLDGGKPKRLLARAGYTPPRSKAVDAAKEAEETFAPGGCQCGRCSDCYGVVPDPDLDR
jgi:hypothetical protein